VSEEVPLDEDDEADVDEDDEEEETEDDEDDGACHAPAPLHLVSIISDPLNSAFS
jgi:hypothetical protein